MTTSIPESSGNSLPSRSQKKWYYLTFVEWCVIALILAVIGALLLPPVQSGGHGGRSRESCKFNLKMIGLALYGYHDAHGTFPPAYVTDADGRPIHSWRVLILPYMDHKKLYDEYRFDEPWNGPHNRLLAGRIATAYHCPTDHPDKQPIDIKYTSYVAVLGTETVWPMGQSTKLSDVKDEMATTLQVVEVSDSDIQWMEPRDLVLSNVTAGINNSAQPWISSKHKRGVHALFVDGHVGFLDEKMPLSVLRDLLTRAGGETVVEY